MEASQHSVCIGEKARRRAIAAITASGPHGGSLQAATIKAARRRNRSPKERAGHGVTAFNLSCRCGLAVQRVVCRTVCRTKVPSNWDVLVLGFLKLPLDWTSEMWMRGRLSMRFEAMVLRSYSATASSPRRPCKYMWHERLVHTCNSYESDRSLAGF